IVKQTAPYASAVFVLLPIPAGLQARVKIGAAITGDAGPSSSFEREGFHDLHSIAAAERERARMCAGGDRIGPQKQPLGSGPDAMKYAPRPILAEKITVPVAKETARSGAEFHERVATTSGLRLLEFANVSLVIGHAHVLRPIL